MSDLSDLSHTVSDLNGELRVVVYRLDTLERIVESRAEGRDVEELREAVAGVREVVSDVKDKINAAASSINDARHKSDNRTKVLTVLIPALLGFLGVLAGLLLGGQ